MSDLKKLHWPDGSKATLHESTGKLRGIAGADFPERELTVDEKIYALAQVHTVFAATVTPLMQELRMLIRNQDTKIARLETEVAMLRMSIPVRIA